jgi:uncharacterized membrane protein YcjF (UPF0283 family)
MNDDTKTKKTGVRKFMYYRENLIFGSIFIGIGLIVFIFALWGESLINTLNNSQWIMLGIRITGVICIFVGIIGFIAALIPKKQ